MARPPGASFADWAAVLPGRGLDLGYGPVTAAMVGAIVMVVEHLSVTAGSRRLTVNVAQ